jgi:hypothetical protein
VQEARYDELLPFEPAALGFMAFAKSFRLPTIYNAIRGAKRVGGTAG